MTMVMFPSPRQSCFRHVATGPWFSSVEGDGKVGRGWWAGGEFFFLLWDNASILKLLTEDMPF